MSSLTTYHCCYVFYYCYYTCPKTSSGRRLANLKSLLRLIYWQYIICLPAGLGNPFPPLSEKMVGSAIYSKKTREGISFDIILAQNPKNPKPDLEPGSEEMSTPNGNPAPDLKVGLGFRVIGL